MIQNFQVRVAARPVSLRPGKAARGRVVANALTLAVKENLDGNMSLKVVGADERLGKWDVDRAPTMVRNGDTWVLSVDMHEGMEYKLVKFDSNTGYCTWEDGENRRVHETNGAFMLQFGNQHVERWEGDGAAQMRMDGTVGSKWEASSDDFFGSGLPSGGNSEFFQSSNTQASYSSTSGGFFADHTPRVEPPSASYAQSVNNQPNIRPASRGFFDDHVPAVPQQSYSAPPQQSYSAPASNDFFGSGLPSSTPAPAAPQQSYSAPASNDFFGSGLPDNKPVQTSGGYSAPQQSNPPRASDDFFGSGLPDNKPLPTNNAPPAPSKGFFD